jgi:hypothetical protein
LEVLRQVIKETLPKPKAPPLPRGVSNTAFGKAAGWGERPWSGVRPSNILQGVRNLKELGISRETVQEWADFYNETAWYDLGNPTAAYRGYWLREIARRW